MAERRMFAKSIVLSDAFLDMPMSARCLYFTLGMFADDDGFVGSPKGIMRQCGASSDDLNVLLAKRYVLLFESGVIVIKHWRINNYLQKDRHKDTTYLEELDTLTTDQKGAYTEKNKDRCIQNVYTEKNRLDKDSKDKVSIGKNIFVPPTVDEVQAYITEKGYHFSAEEFVAFYESNGWKVGKNPMKSWKAACVTWESNYKKKQPNQGKSWLEVAADIERKIGDETIKE